MLVTFKTAYIARRPTGLRRRTAGFRLALGLGLVLACAPPSFAQAPELRPPDRTASATSAANEIPAPTERPPAPASTDAVPPQAAAPRAALADVLDRKGDLTFPNMKMDAALLAIGKAWNVNIVTGKEIEGTVNGVFQQAPLREILDAVLLANGYSYRIVGDSLVVQPTADVGTANPLFQSRTLHLKYGNLDEVVEGAKMLKSAAGQVQAMPSAQSLLIIDYADRVQSIAAFVEHHDAAAAGMAGSASPPGSSATLEVAYFHTHFVPAANVEQTIISVLSPLGRVAIMQKENRLVVVDYAANLEMVRRVLSRVDRPRPQVRITALIYDLSLQDVEQLGLNWGSDGKGRDLGEEDEPKQSLQFESTTLAPFSAGEAGGVLTVRSLTRHFDVNTILQLLQTANDARLLADPNVIVTDNDLAEWKSVSEIPYQQITQSELGGQIGTTAFKEAGITLRVRPTIAGDGTVEMLIEPEFSRLAGFTPQENQPIIDTRKATTNVRVANRQTIVLSGLRQRSDTGEFNGIPFLKDVKYVGTLFRSRDTNVRESELIVFIMPEIIGYDEAPDCRQYDALETIDCRLDRIPPAEGCPPSGQDGCAGGTLMELPPVDGGGYPPGAPMPGAPMGPQAQQPGQLPGMRAQALRSPYDGRFRAGNGATDRRPQQPAQAMAPADPGQFQGNFGF